MAMRGPLRKAHGVLLGCGLLLVVRPPARATEPAVIAAVASNASPDYVRSKLADGSYQSETDAFWLGRLLGRDERRLDR